MKLHMRVAAATALALLLAGCGGGGGGSTSIPGTGSGGTGGGGTGPSNHGTGNVSITIEIPQGSGSSSKSHRSPQYISTNTQAGSVIVTPNGGSATATQYFQLTPSTDPTQCTQTNTTINGQAETYFVCTITIQAPAGLDSFAWSLYSAAATPVGCNLGTATPCTADSGSVLSTFTGTSTVVAGESNDLGTFTLDPVLASFTISATPSLTANGVSSYAVTLVAKDPSGATIIPPGYFANASGTLTPITISNSIQTSSPSDGAPFICCTNTWTGPNAGEAFALSFTSATTPDDLAGTVTTTSYASTGTFNGASDTVTVEYGGLSIPSYTLTAAATGLTSDTTGTYAAALGAPTVAAACNSAYDTCTAGTKAAAGTVSFTGTNSTGTGSSQDDATLTPAEPGWTDSPYSQLFTIESNDCASTDYVTITPSSGTSGSYNAQANNPGECSVTFEDSAVLGQTVTMNFSVTTAHGSLQGKPR